jgi:hypothetical protein
MRTNNILAVLCDQFTSTVPAAEARRTQYDFGRPILIGQDQIVYQPICSVYPMFIGYLNQLQFRL